MGREAGLHSAQQGRDGFSSERQHILAPERINRVSVCVWGGPPGTKGRHRSCVQKVPPLPDPETGGFLQMLVTQTVLPMSMLALPSKPRVRCLLVLEGLRLRWCTSGWDGSFFPCPFPAHLCFCRVAPHPGSQIPGVYHMVLTVTWMHMVLFELCFYSSCASEK